MRLLDHLVALHPTHFENLVYDLLSISGLRNLAWRTPGADGGRDLEGEFLRVDLSGTAVLERWYIECKRYSNALSWPEVRGKIAFAENHSADFLLICTTSTLSSTSRDELARWAVRRARPTIRTWEGPELENRIQLQPDILAKYGLSSVPLITAGPAYDLVQLALRSTSAAYTKAEFSGTTTIELEYAAALVELAQDVITFGGAGPTRRFDVNRDLYEWATLEPSIDASYLDALTFRALLCTVRLVAKVSAVQIRQGPSRASRTFSVYWPGGPGSPRFANFLGPLALWGNFEVIVNPDHLVISGKDVPT